MMAACRVFFIVFAIISPCFGQAFSGAGVEVFYTSDVRGPEQAQIEKWERIMKATRFEKLSVSDNEINAYLLLDAINVRLKSQGAPFFIFFAEPVQSNAAWSLKPLVDLVHQIPSFAPQLKGRGVSESLAKMTLWEIYNDILIGGYGFKKIYRPYGVLMFNG